jgi:hypothetical protein
MTPSETEQREAGRDREIVVRTGTRVTATEPYVPMDDLARQKVGATPKWEVFAWEVLGGPDAPKRDILMTGGIPNITTRRREKWKGVHGERVYGCGVVQEGGKIKRGVVRLKVRACYRCKGTGKPPASAAPAKASVENLPL